MPGRGRLCCGVSTCNNRGVHRLPKDEGLRAQWLSVAGIDQQRKVPYRGLQFRKYTYICSKHFKPSDYIDIGRRTTRLKSTAVPSIFPWTPCEKNVDDFTVTFDPSKVSRDYTRTETVAFIAEVPNAMEVSDITDASDDPLILNDAQIKREDVTFDSTKVSIDRTRTEAVAFVAKVPNAMEVSEITEATDIPLTLFNAEVKKEDLFPIQFGEKKIVITEDIGNHSTHSLHDNVDKKADTHHDKMNKESHTPHGNMNNKAYNQDDNMNYMIHTCGDNIKKEAYTQLVNMSNEVHSHDKNINNVQTSPHDDVNKESHSLHDDNMETLSKEVAVQTYVRLPPFSVQSYRHRKRAIEFFTGLESYEKLTLVFESLGKHVNTLKYLHGTPPKKLGMSPFEQFFMTLIVLRHNKSFKELSMIYLLPFKQVTNIFDSWIRFMSSQWRNLDLWVEKETKKAYFNIPVNCHNEYHRTRVVMFEGPAEGPDLPKGKLVKVWNSKNKDMTKVPILVGVAPIGLITFVSASNGGSASKNEIIKTSDLMKKSDHDDRIYKKRCTSFCMKVDYGSVANEAVQKEVIKLMKKFKILSHLNGRNTFHSNDVVFICAMLVNFQSTHKNASEHIKS